MSQQLLYSPNDKITLVYLNSYRPKNLQLVIKKMSTYPEVGEILVLHTRRASQFASSDPKVVSYGSAARRLFQQFKMTSRFQGCLRAKYNTVLLADDDLIISHDALRRLLRAKQGQPDRVYGIGRAGRVYDPLFPPYTLPEHDGEVDFVVGRTMLVDRRMCGAFFDLKPLVDDVAMLGRTPWGAEDIFMSLAVRAVTGGIRPFTITRSSQDFVNLDAGVGVGISHSPEHYPFRNAFLLISTHRLGCLFPPRQAVGAASLQEMDRVRKSIVSCTPEGLL